MRDEMAPLRPSEKSRRRDVQPIQSQVAPRSRRIDDERRCAGQDGTSGCRDPQRAVRKISLRIREEAELNVRLAGNPPRISSSATQ